MEFLRSVCESTMLIGLTAVSVYVAMRVGATVVVAVGGCGCSGNGR